MTTRTKANVTKERVDELLGRGFNQSDTARRLGVSPQYVWQLTHPDWRRAYLQRPDVKERQRAYYQRPDVKERQRAYKERPDVKERQRHAGQCPICHHIAPIADFRLGVSMREANARDGAKP